MMNDRPASLVNLAYLLTYLFRYQTCTAW